MAGSQVADLLRLLTHRGALLRSIDEGIHDRRALVAELDVSRSTVNRGIRDLREAGLVTERAGGFELTRYGQLALDVYRTGDQLATVEPLVERLPADVPLSTIRNAEVVFPEPPIPQRPIDTIQWLIDEADEVVALAPTVVPSIVESTIDLVRRDELEATVVVDGTVLEGLWSERADVMREGLDTEGYTLLVTEREVSFGLLVVDDRIASIGIHDDTDRLQGLLINEDRETVEWARETFAEYRGSTEEVSTGRVER